MTAKDLLYKILDYNCHWSHQPKSKPGQVRLKQIEQLLGVFGLTKEYINPLTQIKYRLGGQKEELERSQYLNSLSNLQYFRQGEFFNDRPNNLNKELFEKALVAIKPHFPGLEEDYLTRRGGDVPWLFSDLMAYREEAHKLIAPWNGMLEGFSLGLHYSKYLQHHLNKTILDNLIEIDDTLCLIMDPQKREFTNEEINFKEIDLQALDLEWRMENF